MCSFLGYVIRIAYIKKFYKYMRGMKMMAKEEQMSRVLDEAGLYGSRT